MIGRDIVFLLILSIIAVIGERAMAILVPLAANARGASNSWVGILVGAPALVLVLAMIPGTWFVASWRRRTVLAVGIGLISASLLGQGVVTHRHWMLLPQITIGLGVALFFPAYLSYFAALVAGRIANEMQGRRAAVTGLAFLIAPIIATYLAEKLGYGGAFFTMGIVAAFTVVIPLFFMSPASRSSSARWRGHDLVNTYHHAGILLRRPGFLMIVVVNAIAAMLFGQVGGPFLALYIRGLGFSETAVGGFIGLRSLGETVLQLAFGRMAKRILPAYLLAFSVISGGFLFLGVPAISAPLLLGGLLLVIGIVHAPRNPAVIGIASGQFSDEERDLGMALLFTVGNVVIALASPALGALGDAAGLNFVFLVGGCLAMGVTVMLTVVGRRVALRENAPSTMVELWGTARESA